MVHKLKINPKFFHAVIQGYKTCEVRKADRPFAVGDLLELNEFVEKTGNYTDNSCTVSVSHILTPADSKLVQAGTVIISFNKILVMHFA